MNIAINGFGRIGRQALRIIQEKHPELKVVLINDLTDAATLAHLFAFDSTYGRYEGKLTVEGDTFVTPTGTIKITAEKDPTKLPLKDLQVDIVLECTGRFTKRELAAVHLASGAKKVIISAPAEGADGTFCLGVNADSYDTTKHHVISNASCTTNCLAPMAKVLHEQYGIVSGLMTTIHSFTNDQMLLDLPHKDLRRARSAPQSMVPTSTGAAKAIGEVIPALAGKMHGVAIRVPTPTVSITDLTVVTEKPVTIEALMAAYEAAASGPMQGILQVEKRPLVSRDFVRDAHSCSIDAALTEVKPSGGAGSLVKVFGWYDNEWGYANRLVELAAFVGSKL
jgi:glyceraldehyde 3-phosphate dehydrogenase